MGLFSTFLVGADAIAARARPALPVSRCPTGSGRSPRERPHFHGWRIGQAWHDIRFAVLTYSLEYPEPPMREVVRFVPKAELERARLIREARVIYEHIFPPADQASKRPDPDK